MTYGYLLAIPCIGAPSSTQSHRLSLTIPLFVGFYAITMAKIKYEEGYMDLRVLGYGVIPKPHQFWSKANISWILPTNLVFATGWSMEITSHLEELAFWLFLLHQVRMVETPSSSFGGKETAASSNHPAYRDQASATGSQAGNSEVGSSVQLWLSRVSRP